VEGELESLHSNREFFLRIPDISPIENGGRKETGSNSIRDIRRLGPVAKWWEQGKVVTPRGGTQGKTSARSIGPGHLPKRKVPVIQKPARRLEMGLRGGRKEILKEATKKTVAQVGSC